MAGPLKTLVSMLQASVYLTGVDVRFGEEEIDDLTLVLPSVVIVPNGGPFTQWAGYSKGFDPDTEALWGTIESIDVKCWARSSSPTATPIDHADAVESLIPLVLSAFQDQRMNQGFVAGGGLYYKPINGRWELMKNSLVRFGRGFTLTFSVEKTYAMAPPPSVTNPSLTLTATITT